MSRPKRRGAKVGHWRSREGFASYRTAYDAVMATMPAPDRAHDVATYFGTVRVYEWAAAEDAPPTALPVVMLPGIRSGAPMWGENLSHWHGKRPLYAMDAIGDCGLSTQSVPLTEFGEHTLWVEEALTRLRLGRVHLMGHSFGGALAGTHALRYPARSASITLLEPVMVLRPLPAAMYLWSAMLLLPVPQSWKDYALARIGGVSIEEVRQRTPLSVMVDEGSKNYASVTLVPRTLTDADWKSLPMPVRVDIAGEKSLAGGEEAANRAKTLGKEVTVWPETTHSLPVQAAEQLGSQLEQYWTSHDG